MTSRRPAPPSRPLPPGLSRRSFLRGLSAGALGLAGGGLLSACGVEAAQQTTASCTSEDLSAEEPMLNFSNWTFYIDPIKAKDVSTLEAFQKRTGITVDYTTDISDNAAFFGKVRNQLADCQPTGRDMFVLTDWMAAKMIGLGWIQELDKANLPNVEANLLENLRSPGWDPERKYSVPWQSGLAGICYNSELTKEVGSFEELLTRADLKGKVTLLSEMPDTMAFMLRVVGADPSDFTADEFSEAIERLQQAVDSGQIRKFTGNEYTRELKSGNVVACEAWSGDVIQLQFEDPKYKFVVPEEGLALWSDNMLVPNKATHKTNAETLMDYYYDPEVAAELAAWVNYICPVQGAQEAMAKFDKSLVDNQLIFPDESFLAKTFVFMGLTSEQEQDYQTQFQQVIGA